MTGFFNVIMNLKLVCKNKILTVSYQNSSLKYLVFWKTKDC